MYLCEYLAAATCGFMLRRVDNGGSRLQQVTNVFIINPAVNPIAPDKELKGWDFTSHYQMAN